MKKRHLAIGAALAGAFLYKRSRLPPSRRVPDIPPARGAGSLWWAVQDLAYGKAHRSGLHLLSEAEDAFAARMLLIKAAERTLDLQYYIWHGDRTGTLLLNAVLEAGDRGVRVRLLLDDNGIPGLDPVLAALDKHPMISVRIFNPFAIRFPKAVGFVLDFPRLNRRMHNKSLTVDGAATIVGGRNIGDEYFGSGDGGLFLDLDVLAIGRIVGDVERDFDRYWTCASAYPASQILPRARPRILNKLRRAAGKVAQDPQGAGFLRRVRSRPIIDDLRRGRLSLEWAPMSLLSDDPAKGLGCAPKGSLLAGKLVSAVGRPRRSLNIISGYFVPGPDGTRQLAEMACAGVKVSVLTNSFQSGDVKAVHAGYAPARCDLLDAGVRLFELKGTDSAPDSRSGTRAGIGNRLRGTGTGSTAALRSGATTLHAKTVTVDDKTLFVGSFNFDPRSWQLNCEMGFVIESPRLACTVARAFNDRIPEKAYALRLRRDIEWVEAGRQPRVHSTEPGLGRLAAAGLAIAQRLPIRWLL